MKHILHVMGARPNFMKVAPVHMALANRTRQTVIHTGQHYDASMSDIFLQQLGLPKPDVHLGIGSASHAVQTARIMSAIEPVVLERAPDIVLVYGDVNSTVAAALVCSKLLIPIGHVEAGLRSGDRRMPEEINRLVTDAVADLLFTPSADADEHLRREGVPESKIHRIGNVMIDTLVRLLPSTDPEAALRHLDVTQPFVLVTLHRPSNVDDPAILQELVGTLASVSLQADVVFPVHPRTRERLRTLPAAAAAPRLKLLEPLGYLEFLSLQRAAAVVVTDSGGIQEETTYLGVPCVTVRENTERPVTVSIGTNVLVGRDMVQLRCQIAKALQAPDRRAEIPPLWDGRAAERLANILLG